MKFSELNQIVKGEMNLAHDYEIESFVTDTRELIGRANEVFIALKANRDGHDFVEVAIEKGIRNFIVSKPINTRGVNVLLVENTLESLQKIATKHRSRFQAPVIAITGSNGKTTVKEWLASILSEIYFVCKSPKSYNSQIGVPLSLLSLNEQHEVGVFEAGISKVGEMDKLSQMIAPSIGAFTMLGSAHDDGFENQNQKILEKLKLFATCKKVIVRSDQEEFETIRKTLGEKIVSWSTTKEADYQVEWSEGTLIVNSKKFRCDLEGETTLENLTSCIVTSLEMGVAEKHIQKVLDEIRPVPMRLEIKKGINNSYIIDDTYNNDLEGIKVAINTLSNFQQRSKKTLILSDILHARRKGVYTEIGKLLQEKRITRLVGVGENIKQVAFHFDGEISFFQDTNSLLNSSLTFENEVVLVKGARDFKLEQVVSTLQEERHGTRLEVSLDALRENLNQYRKLLKPDTKMMVMVKANAYGLGILEVAGFLQNHQVDQLGVAYVDEAIQLRKNGITLPIMIMNPHIESFVQFEKYDLQAEIFNLDHLKRLIADTKLVMKIQIKIETGMHRLGFSKDELQELIKVLKGEPRIKVEGIFTHFASSENQIDDNYTIDQASEFDRIYEEISNAIGIKPMKHACNSSGIIRWPNYHYDMVRLGIGLYGFDPTGTLMLDVVGKLKSIVSQVQSLKSGQTIGYSRKGKVEKDSKIAVIPIGYEDGFRRMLGNGNSQVNIKGQLYPTIGNVCMDMIMVDVTEGNVQEGDEVEIFGDNPSIQQVSKWSDTIPYEVLTSISSRVRRVYISG